MTFEITIFTEPPVKYVGSSGAFDSLRPLKVFAADFRSSAPVLNKIENAKNAGETPRVNFPYRGVDYSFPVVSGVPLVGDAGLDKTAFRIFFLGDDNFGRQYDKALVDYHRQSAKFQYDQYLAQLDQEYEEYLNWLDNLDTDEE